MRVLAVVVLYKLKPSESAALNTLQAAISCLENRQADIQIVPYDNTPAGQDFGVSGLRFISPPTRQTQ
jgi:hypothetical protein